MPAERESGAWILRLGDCEEQLHKGKPLVVAQGLHTGIHGEAKTTSRGLAAQHGHDRSGPVPRPRAVLEAARHIEGPIRVPQTQ
jgi:hypothetical protein